MKLTLLKRILFWITSEFYYYKDKYFPVKKVKEFWPDFIWYRDKYSNTPCKTCENHCVWENRFLFDCHCCRAWQQTGKKTPEFIYWDKVDYPYPDDCKKYEMILE